MSRIHRLRRRAGQSVVIHDRARSLAARRLDEPLEPADAAWLADHLAGCAACRSTAAAYEADRLLLRSLRDRQPEPPRDLWARTAAAIERESAAHGARTARPAAAAAGRARVHRGRGCCRGRPRRDGVVGRVPERPTECGDRATGDAAAGRRGAVVDDAGPTPIAVGAGSVGWVGTDPDGKFAYNVTKVSEVCPAERQPDCAPVRILLEAGRHADPAEVDLEIAGPQPGGRRRDQRGRR
jgi:hypothetical protein